MIKLSLQMTVFLPFYVSDLKEREPGKKRTVDISGNRKDFKTFMKIRYGILGQTMNIPGRSGRKISSLAYSVARRIIGFN